MADTWLTTGIAHTLVQNKVYGLPAKAVLASSNAAIEISQDGLSFSPVTLTNMQATLSAMFIRSTLVGTIVSLKEFAAYVSSGGTAGDVTADNVLALDYVAVGANPAQSGAIRLSSGEQINFRNAANNQDRLFASDNGFGSIQMGDGNNALYIYTSKTSIPPGILEIGTNPAQSGALRLANNQFVVGRDIPNTSDVQLIGFDSQGYVTIGSPGTSNYVRGGLFFYERSAPAAPILDGMNMWTEDNGSGKTRLMVRFGSGAAIQLAIQL